MLDNVIVLLNLVFVRANILEIPVKWKRDTRGVGAGPGSPDPLPDHGATGAPAGVPRWPSTTPKWLRTLRVTGTQPSRCGELGCVLGLFVIELGGYPIRHH
jgi:hypothetical protein